MAGKIRKASHAGSWYEKNGPDLHSQLNEWLHRKGESHGPARAIIAPHAGYYYCGSCGGQAYRQVDPSNIERVFILGPSHHVRLSGCALSVAESYDTPLYPLPIDKSIYAELRATGRFEDMSMRTDEDEHSIEMHLPYIAAVMEPRRGSFTVVPILVGSLNTSNERLYGQIFADYLGDPKNLFVISSDFCHWGSRFHYQHFEKSWGTRIWQSIEHLDKKGMELIEKLDTAGFTSYLREFGNTICGRHPIAVLLNAVDALKQKNGHRMSMRFVDYAQSSKCSSMSDSSVSYASASLVIT